MRLFSNNVDTSPLSSIKHGVCAVCTVLGASEVLYCCTYEWTLELNLLIVFVSLEIAT